MQQYFDFTSVIIILLRRWKLILINCIIACIFAIIYSFLIAEKQYVSSITFLPPAEEQKSITNLLPGVSLGALSSTDLAPQQFVTIFNSKYLRKQIFEKYGYYNKFKLEKSINKFELSIKRFSKDLILNVEELGSLGATQHISYTMKCFHTSPDTSVMILQFVYSFLDSTIKEISSNKGKNNRIFVESQILLNKRILDSLQKEFEQFQKQNKVFEVKTQVQLSLEAYAELKAQIVSNEIKIQSLMREYGHQHPLITDLKKTNNVIKSKIDEIENNKSPNVIMGLDKTTEIMPIYSNLIRDIEVQNKIIILLMQQLEEAKLKEAKDISRLTIIDPPYLPKYKVRPKRIVLVVEIVAVYVLLLILILLFIGFYSLFIKKTSLYGEVIKIFKR